MTTASRAAAQDRARLRGRDGLRADAQRNHDKVFVAAVELFAAHGEEATIPDIAARAGVGKATVYRSYPTKADLIDAVVHEQMAWLDARVEGASLADDAFVALSALLGEMAERLAGDRLFGQALALTTQWGSDRERRGSIAEIFAQAQRQGRLRPDATVEDLRVLIGGFARVLLGHGVRDPQQWRRYTSLVLDALRTHEAAGGTGT